MTKLELLKEIVATYERYGWRLQKVLINQTPRAAVEEFSPAVTIEAADYDAAWFARPSHGTSEAWELRLVGEERYALFETFEADEAEAEREEVRAEMQARLRAKVTGEDAGAVEVLIDENDVVLT